MGLFFTLLPPPEKWKFQKNEEKPYRYNHFTLVYQKSWLYAILFLRNGMWQMYLLFFILAIFCPFTPLTAQKTKISKNFKKCLEISSFYTSVPKTMIICTKNHDYMLYCSWDMAHDGCNCCFSFWAIFCLSTPLTAQKLKISKNEKNTWRYHHFTNVHQKLWLDDVQLLRYVAWWMDRQMDGGRDGWTDEWMDIWTEKVTYREVGGPPKNKFSKIMLICYRRF